MEKKKIIPLITPQYTLEDLSVVIPQASQYQKRLEWFLAQYIKATPQTVIDNTIVCYDPEDNHAASFIAAYKLQGLKVTPPHSTYKMQAGFNQIKTRLCARVHNDAFFARDDWAQSLVAQFNTEKTTQLIGYFNPSGSISKEAVDKFLEWYPSFKSVYDILEYNEANQVGANFLGAYFMASQTYVFRGIYPLIVDFNEGKMDKEDCLLTLFAMHFGVDIVSWRNQGEFIRTVSPAYGDFDEGLEVPTEPYHAVEGDQLKAVFGRAVELWPQ